MTTTKTSNPRRPIYHHETVTYRFCGKWEFTTTTADGKAFSILKPLPGVEAAHKVAKIIAGALKRTKGQGLDGLARANIEQMA